MTGTVPLAIHVPTSSISPACQGFTILFSSMIVVLSRFGWVKLKKDNKKAMISWRS